MDEDIYKPFTKILTFVKELNNTFGNKYQNIQLYYKLLKKTPVSNKVAIKKQNLVFSTFLTNNEEAVLKSDYSLFKDDKISFSDRVYINIRQIISESEDASVMFKHLQLISILFKKDDKMIEALKSENDDKEGQFLNKFMNKVETVFNTSDTPETDPMKAAMSLIQSGVLSDMTKEISTGKLNINKLLGNLQGMMKDVVKDIKVNKTNEPEEKKDEEIEKMMDSMSNGDFSGAMNLANSMMSQMGGQGGMEGGLLNMVSSLMGGQGGPDNIMSMMGNMMGNNVNIETIKDEDTLE
jgi:hypothetical protein